MVLEHVRQPLLNEARQSPSLLSDLAGLEHYVAESYSARSFIELLQNADDAGSSRFLVRLIGDALVVANDGRPFSTNDFESLCRSASSTKERGTSIGYRGIGFKSVVHFATEVHLFSGDLNATFSRQRTATDVPAAQRCPLVRIPHQVRFDEVAEFQAVVSALKHDGYGTVFVFSGLQRLAIESEFDAFDPSSLLFLRNVREVKLQTSSTQLMSVEREVIDRQHMAVVLSSPLGKHKWVLRQCADVVLAFRRDETVSITHIDQTESVAHAFLPTSDPTGFGLKINGDFSTDPSRTKVVMDDESTLLIEHAAAAIVDLIQNVASGNDDVALAGVGNALVPDADPRLVGFQRKSFRTALLTEVRSLAVGKLSRYRICPSWLNEVDFVSLAHSGEIKTLPTAVAAIAGFPEFMRQLGVPDLGIQEIQVLLPTAQITNQGSAEIVSALAQAFSLRQVGNLKSLAKVPLWVSGREKQSLADLEKLETSLDQEFFQLVLDRGTTKENVHRLILEMANIDVAKRLVPSRDSQPDEPILDLLRSGTSVSVPVLKVARWRETEQQVVEVLNAQGWKLLDVSRQNQGYDLAGTTSSGREVFIEVKSLEHFRSPFTMTNNEVLVAREKQDTYALALVIPASDGIEMALVWNPGMNMVLERQCRQWVWECETYEVSPIRYSFDS